MTRSNGYLETVVYDQTCPMTNFHHKNDSQKKEKKLTTIDKCKKSFI